MITKKDFESSIRKELWTFFYIRTEKVIQNFEFSTIHEKQKQINYFNENFRRSSIDEIWSIDLDSFIERFKNNFKDFVEKSLIYLYLNLFLDIKTEFDQVLAAMKNSETKKISQLYKAMEKERFLNINTEYFFLYPQILIRYLSADITPEEFMEEFKYI